MAWLVSHVRASVKSGDTCTIRPQAAGVERAQHPLARVLIEDQHITAPSLAVGIGRCYVYRMSAAAHYRLELKAVGRSSGRQICAAAAYGSRSTIHDIRQNRTFTFTNRRDLLHSEIITPENAPDWTRDRASLWNRVEAAERRKDSTTGRELTLSLPRGLNDAQKIAAVRSFARRELLPRGLPADLSIHRAQATDGGEQDHAHVLIPTRSLDGDAFAAKKLDWLGRPKHANDEMQALRAAWAGVLNEALEAAGIDRRVSHLSRDARRAQAAAVAADETRDLTPRTAAAVEAIALAQPAESKIGYRVVAQARREIEKAARTTGEVIELAPYLARRSPAAAKVYAQRAARAALAAELAPSIWTAVDQAAVEAVARAQADAAAASKPSPAPAPAPKPAFVAPVPFTTKPAPAIQLVTSKPAPVPTPASVAPPLDQERARREAAQRARDVAALGAKLDREKGRDAGWRRVNELGAGIEHGDGRTIVLAPTVAAVAGYDATIKPGMRALIASDDARSKEPILLRALFARELEAAKEAGRKVVALIDRGARAFAAWVQEAAPHAEHLLPPGDALTWASLAPELEPDLPDDDHDDDDRRDDDFSPT